MGMTTTDAILPVTLSLVQAMVSTIRTLIKALSDTTEAHSKSTKEEVPIEDLLWALANRLPRIGNKIRLCHC